MPSAPTVPTSSLVEEVVLAVALAAEFARLPISAYVLKVFMELVPGHGFFASLWVPRSYWYSS